MVLGYCSVGDAEFFFLEKLCECGVVVGFLFVFFFDQFADSVVDIVF